MKQAVTVIQTADRHAELHRRDFAAAHEATVASDNLREVLTAALDTLPALPPGRYVVLVDWPHE